MEAPHRIVGNLADSVVNAINGVGNGATRTVEGAGEAVQSALDKPFNSITGREGPLRAADAAAKGAVDAVSELGNGFVGSIKTVGNGIMKALDHPLEQIGMGNFKMPKFMKK